MSRPVPPATAAVMMRLRAEFHGMRCAAKHVANICNRSTRTVENWFGLRNAMSVEDVIRAIAHSDAVREEILRQADIIKQEIANAGSNKRGTGQPAAQAQPVLPVANTTTRRAGNDR